jgi:hypothetical protein
MGYMRYISCNKEIYIGGIVIADIIKMGRCEWGAEKGKEYYVLRIHSVKVWE